RNIKEHPNPVFLFVDEAANFLFPTDESFQERARSNRICTVYLAQTLHSYMNGFKGNHHAAHALLGNLALKVFHQSGDTFTNQYAADLIGQKWMTVGSWNTSTNPNDTGSGGGSDAVHYEVLPREFGNLRTGGLRNNLIVEGIVFAGGRHFDATGSSWMKVEFKQGE
ncbi:MAG: TraM recognition domain-containing protein, partial [Cyanobacteria bacterium J06626_14]